MTHRDMLNKATKFEFSLFPVRHLLSSLRICITWLLSCKWPIEWFVCPFKGWALLANDTSSETHPPVLSQQIFVPCCAELSFKWCKRSLFSFRAFFWMDTSLSILDSYQPRSRCSLPVSPNQVWQFVLVRGSHFVGTLSLLLCIYQMILLPLRKFNCYVL